MESSEVICVAAAHHEVRTEIVIAAPPAHVWTVLTDFTSMPTWSPSFKGIIGEFATGCKVLTLFDMGEGIEEYSAILHVRTGAEFGWSEDYDGIRDDHCYRVEEAGEAQTRFVQTDAFKGQADWANTADLADLYVEQYTAFNRALKAECERRLGVD